MTSKIEKKAIEILQNPNDDKIAIETEPFISNKKSIKTIRNAVNSTRNYVFEPWGRFKCIWSGITTMFYCYNLWVIIFRFSMSEINQSTIYFWLILDSIADFTYIVDILIELKTAYYLNGILEKNLKLIRLHYKNSVKFYVDLISLTPFEILYVSFGFISILRCARLLKIVTVNYFIEALERHMTYPKIFLTLVSNDRKENGKYKDKLEMTKSFLRKRNISKDMEKKIINYYDYLWYNKNTIDEKINFSFLPRKIQIRIQLLSYSDILSKIDLFENAEIGFIEKLVEKLQPQTFCPNDYVFFKNDIGVDMYIIVDGKIEVIENIKESKNFEEIERPDKKDIIATLTKGTYFGELAIFNIYNVNRRSANVRSVGYSNLLSLSKKNLLVLLQNYPAVKEKFEYIGKKRYFKFIKIDNSNTNLTKSANTINEYNTLNTLQTFYKNTRYLTVPPKELHSNNKSKNFYLNSHKALRQVRSSFNSPIINEKRFVFKSKKTLSDSLNFNVENTNLENLNQPNFNVSTDISVSSSTAPIEKKILRNTLKYRHKKR
ncbi:hypothetical protein A3Q56_06764 [Intoshia linei]|uniref:Cyclic nucleotide-binding domain-containing protein n=1 Tax=Intoshia linei TaxID=1819745 RepID=A0A177AU17_9BILA|nr:hypothetical protein A3Q56_06764 [Intoshia linei]